MVAARKIPDFLLQRNSSMIDLLYWIIEPHVIKSYQKYKPLDDERARISTAYVEDFTGKIFKDEKICKKIEDDLNEEKRNDQRD